MIISSRQAAKDARAMIANHGQRVLLSNKNKQNPCRDYSLSPSRKGRKGYGNYSRIKVFNSDKNNKNPCRDYFLSPSRKGRKGYGNYSRIKVFNSNKNKKNPCRDARAAPSVSFWYRRVSKQASARRHQKETAFVPQACITARKTGKTADAATCHASSCFRG